MSRWTHSICETCWNEKNPDRRVPHIILDSDNERCCFCGLIHGSGIYLRADPKETRCGGISGTHEGENQ